MMLKKIYTVQCNITEHPLRWTSQKAVKWYVNTLHLHCTLIGIHQHASLKPGTKPKAIELTS